MIRSKKITLEELSNTCFLLDKARNEAFKGKGLCPIDLRVLAAGAYITRDYYGFSLRQVVNLIDNAYENVRLSIKRLEKGLFVKVVRPAGGKISKRFSALYSLTADGVALLSRFNELLVRYLKRSADFELEFR